MGMGMEMTMGMGMGMGIGKRNGDWEKEWEREKEKEREWEREWEREQAFNIFLILFFPVVQYVPILYVPCKRHGEAYVTIEKSTLESE
jgi:hypothetical protein